MKKIFPIGFTALSCLMYQVRCLKNFNQNLTTYIFKWIPNRLIEDLTDDTNEQNSITHNFQGFTIRQIFSTSSQIFQER